MQEDVVPGFPLGPFTRFAANPILRPQGNGWESANLYNPAAIVVGDEVLLLYRAHGSDLVSRIGLARSRDGLYFERDSEPILVPEHQYERAGCEDPRVTELDGTFYLTYTGFDGRTALLCLATSNDLHRWTKHGPLFPGFTTWATLPVGPVGPWSKAGVLAPRRIEGRYHLWFGEGALYHATSDDGIHWEPPDPAAPLYRPTPGRWDSTLVEIGAPPVRTADGLLVFLINGATVSSPGQVDYRCGQVAIAEAEPDRVLAATTEPWLRPETAEERQGLVPNVTFVEGLVCFRQRWFAYYGQADTNLAVAVFDPATDSYRAGA